MYHFWMLWILGNRPSKRDFPKFSKISNFEKHLDFASAFLLSKITSTGKKQWFEASLGKYIINVVVKISLFDKAYESMISQLTNWQKWGFHMRLGILAHSEANKTEQQMKWNLNQRNFWFHCTVFPKNFTYLLGVDFRQHKS